MSYNQEPISYDNYFERLQQLLDFKKITTDQFSHFRSRGIKIIHPLQNFGLESLGRVLPQIVIGASDEFIRRMKIPYQATSFLVANTKPDLNGWYVYKIPEQPKGGLQLLSGGKRRIGDNVFASTHRIIMGRKAILVSAVNLMANKDNIWNWHFFGDHLKQENESLYNDLVKLDTIMKDEDNSENSFDRASPYYYLVIARSESTFKKLNVVDNYLQNKIAVLNPKNNIHVIFLTDQSGYEFASKRIEESSLVEYIATGETFNTFLAMQELKRKYGIAVILNDGGRIMSDGIRKEGLLAEERMSLEPFPGEDVFPLNKYIDPTTVAGSPGLGLDGGEVEGTLLLHSNKVDEEKLNVYIYPLEERQVIRS